MWEDCSWTKKYYEFKPPFINKYDGNIKHALVKYLWIIETLIEMFKKQYIYNLTSRDFE